MRAVTVRRVRSFTEPEGEMLSSVTTGQGGVVLLRDAAVFLGECVAGQGEFGKRGEVGKCEQRNSCYCRDAVGTVL